MNNKIKYSYFVYPLNQEETAYKAVIPAFNNAVVFGEDLKELEKGIQFTIDEEIKDFKKNGKSVPNPDKLPSVNGRILIRMEPVLHEKLMLEAKANKLSLNNYIVSKLAD